MANQMLITEDISIYTKMNDAQTTVKAFPLSKDKINSFQKVFRKFLLFYCMFW